jgi:hypothetical protein
MMQQLDTIRKTRRYLLHLVAELNNEELNEVPAGFNNNIIWNLGHMVAAQQGICYLRAGLPAKTEDAFFAAYRPGSKPEGKVDDAAVARIKELMSATLDQLEQDYANGLWAQYPAWSTRYGVEINSIESAIDFLKFHEGLHSGFIMALKRVVKPAVATV